jgi:PAS domain S-box-containing protein
MAKKNSSSRREDRLRLDLKLLKAAVDAAKESILITDREGAIRYANPAFEKSTGYTLVEVFDKNPRFLKSGHHDRAFYKQLWDTILSGDTWEGLIINNTRGGEEIYEETTITPVFDRKGEITHFAAIKRDVTEKNQLRERLEMTEKMASAGVLAAGVAHEVNNPLTLVVGFSQILTEDERLPDDVREIMAKVYQNAQRASKIVTTLLEFGRKQEPQKTRVPVQDLFDRIEPLAGYDLKRAGIAYEFKSACEGCVLHADLNQMEQILLNLIINAKQAMQDSPVKKLEVSCRRTEDCIAIAVKDTGPGIPPDKIKKIFEPFFTTKPVGQGTGLGLAICYGIAEDHGGSIEVNSEPGKGTEFLVLIPKEPGTGCVHD